jgi:hypothetical protein
MNISDAVARQLLDGGVNLVHEAGKAYAPYDQIKFSFMPGAQLEVMYLLKGKSTFVQVMTLPLPSVGDSITLEKLEGRLTFSIE